jgi:hypothetical protein
MGSMGKRNSHRLDQVLQAVRDASLYGVTCPEVEQAMGIHHGTASGALSRLDRTGQITRLLTKRDGSSVYVMPEHAPTEDIAPSLRRPKMIVIPDGPSYADGVAAGIEEGRSKGWMEGYDEGIAIGRSTVREEAYASAEGRVKVMEKRLINADRVSGELLRILDPNGVTAPHRGDCWRQHPACAVRAIRKALV